MCVQAGPGRSSGFDELETGGPCHLPKFSRDYYRFMKNENCWEELTRMILILPIYWFEWSHGHFAFTKLSWKWRDWVGVETWVFQASNAGKWTERATKSPFPLKTAPCYSALVWWYTHVGRWREWTREGIRSWTRKVIAKKNTLRQIGLKQRFPGIFFGLSYWDI